MTLCIRDSTCSTVVVVCYIQVCMHVSVGDVCARDWLIAFDLLGLNLAILKQNSGELDLRVRMDDPLLGKIPSNHQIGTFLCSSSNAFVSSIYDTKECGEVMQLLLCIFLVESLTPCLFDQLINSRIERGTIMQTLVANIIYISCTWQAT